MVRKCVIVRYGEIGTKSRVTFRNFIKKLLINIEESLNLNNISFDKIVNPKGRIVIYTQDRNSVTEYVRKVFGVKSLSSAIKCDLDLEKIKMTSLKVFNNSNIPKSKFRVTTKRLTKDIEMNSMEISNEVGSFILEEGKEEPQVDLEDYEIEVNIEIFNEKAYIFSDTIEGYGGLPIGSQGKLVGLISDKDSALAAWLLMKRGCKIHPINFETSFLSDRVEDFMGFLDEFSYGSKFEPEYISFNKEKEDVNNLINEFKRQKFYKPLLQMKMLQKAEEIAKKQNANGIVMGNKLESEKDLKIIRMNKRVINTPIYYPLISNSEEIIDQIKEKIDNLISYNSYEVLC